MTLGASRGWEGVKFLGVGGCFQKIMLVTLEWPFISSYCKMGQALNPVKGEFFKERNLKCPSCINDLLCTQLAPVPSTSKEIQSILTNLPDMGTAVSNEHMFHCNCCHV